LPNAVAVDAALVEVMVQGARTAAAAEGMTLAAVAGLVLGRQEAARAESIAWRRDHPEHPSARQAWDVASADCDDSVAGEVAAALRLSRRAARARVDLALDLATIAPATFTALRAGVLDVPRARRIVEALEPVHVEDPALAARIEDEILTRAPDRTAAQVAATARRLVLRHAPRTVPAATEKAQTERRVGVEHGCDPSGRDAGRASLWVQGRADRVQAAFDNLTRAARAHLDAHPGESRTLDHVRADLALTALPADLRTGRLRTDDPGGDPANRDTGPTPAGDLDPDPADPTRVPDPPVAVHLVLPLSTLAGGDEPGELLGHGPIPAPLARDLLVRTTPGRHTPDGHPVTVMLRDDVTFTRRLTDPRDVVVATPPPPAGPRRRRLAPCVPGTSPAAFPAAAPGRTAAISTTPSPGPEAGPPRPTSPPSAAATTRARPRAAGAWFSTRPPRPSPGPLPADTPTPPTPRPGPKGPDPSRPPAGSQPTPMVRADTAPWSPTPRHRGHPVPWS
jgi:hypothetical protein